MADQIPAGPPVDSNGGSAKPSFGSEVRIVDDQTIADRDQTNADADQTGSDTDQTTADSDQAASESDQEMIDQMLARGD